jgi:hypothetical protein
VSSSLFTEALESRTLFSVSPATEALSHAVTLDRAQIQQDLLKFRSDALANFTALQADVNTIKGEHPKNADTVFPLVSKFRTDIGAMWSQLEADRLAERQNVLSDESVIMGDLRKMGLDKGNAAAETADHGKLLTDRIKMQTDMIAGLNSRLTTRSTDYSTLFNDVQAIQAAVSSDPHASPELVSSVQKWSTDRTTCLNTMSGDLQTLVADRTKLVTDLTAMQTA